MAKPQIQSRSYLESRKDRSWDRSFSWYSLTTFRTLFADDCVLYRNINSLTDCQILQDDPNSLAQWETDWQKKFNVAKCHSRCQMSLNEGDLAITDTSATLYTNRPPDLGRSYRSRRGWKVQQQWSLASQEVC